jgi:hypothetical protein
MGEKEELGKPFHIGEITKGQDKKKSYLGEIPGKGWAGGEDGESSQRKRLTNGQDEKNSPRRLRGEQEKTGNLLKGRS